MELQEGNQSKVRIADFKGEKALIKSVPHPRIPGLRRIEWGILKREAKILQKLSDIPQIPRFLGFTGQYGFAMEWREGRSLREINPGSLPAVFFQTLEATVKKIHQRGIVHSDLKRKENILVDPNNLPVLLDFGASFVKKSGWRLFNNWLYRQFRQIDLNAVAKYKVRYAPSLLTDKEKQQLEHPVFFERVSRFGRKYILFRE